MGIIRNVVRTLAVRVHNQIEFMASHPVSFQETTFKNLIKKAANTEFGKEHNFNDINSYSDYIQKVPLNSYEDLRPYIDKSIEGEKNILWPGLPKYIIETTGTAGGRKLIPITKDSLPYQFNTARNAVFNYTLKYGMLRIFDGKLLFLSGDSTIDKSTKIKKGRLSAIANQQVPSWLKFNQLPGSKVNQIEEWEEKIYLTAKEAIGENVTMLGGLPPWVLMFYEKILEQSGAETISQLFPNYELFVHGGVNFMPYKKKLNSLVGKEIETIETYPSSEGFIAFQDIRGDAGMLLNVNGGLFFEFIPANQAHLKHPERMQLKDVEVGKEYAVVMSTNAGLFALKLGDIIEFTSTNPFRIIIKGRVEHFLSAFGEHIIAQDVETALATALSGTGIHVSEFTVAPQVNPIEGGLPYHEWIVETQSTATELSEFGRVLDQCLQATNFQYKELVQGKAITRLKITPVPEGTFKKYLKAIGKVGGHEKLPHLSNDRKLAEGILSIAKQDITLIT